MSSFKEGIADWLKKMVAESGDMQGEAARIVERYRARGIPCFEAKLEQQAQVALFSRSAVEFTALESELPEAPRLVAITLGESRPAQDYKDTVFWNHRNDQALRDLVGHERPVDACRELHAALSDKPLGYKVYCYFDGACLVLERFTLLSFLLMPQQQPQQPDEDDDGEEVDLYGGDDDFDPSAYEKKLKDRQDFFRSIAVAAAHTEGFRTLRNKRQRKDYCQLVADEMLAKNFNEYQPPSEWEIGSIADEANDIYELGVLPAAAKRMQSDGVPTKEISKTLGISVSKVEKALDIETPLYITEKLKAHESA